MKKILLICMGVVLASSIFAQTSITNAPKLEAKNASDLKLMDASTRTSLNTNGNRAALSYEWISFSDVVTDEFGGDPSYYAATFMPDSLFKFVDDQGAKFANWRFGFGTVLDLNSEATFDYYDVTGEIHPGVNRPSNDDATKLTERGYYIKAFNLNYNYERGLGDSTIVDTLRVYLMDGSDISYLYTSDQRWASVPVKDSDKEDLRPNTFAQSFEILLTKDSASATTTTIDNLTIELDDSLYISKDALMGFAVSYFPGKSHVDGDIIFNQAGEIDSFNVFSAIMIEESQGAAPISSEEDPWNLTQGLFASSETRYATDTSANASFYNDNYLSTFLYSDSWSYEHFSSQWLIGTEGNNFIATKNGREVTFTAKDNFEANDWTWELGDDNVAGAQSFTYTYATAGAYNVCLTSKKGSKSYTYCDRVSVTWGIGIEENFTTFDVYPNPANDNLTIDIATLDNGVQVSIYNMLGQEMYNNISSSNSFKQTIDVSNFAQGVYTVKVTNNNHTTDTKVIIE